MPGETIGVIASIAVASVSMIIAGISLVWGVKAGRKANENDRRIRQYWHRRYSEVSVASVPGHSMVLTVRNPAPEPAHNFYVYARVPDGAKILNVSNPGFTIKSGGPPDGQYVLFHKWMMMGMQAFSLTLHAEQEGKEISSLDEVMTWSDEERGFISIPPTIAELVK